MAPPSVVAQTYVGDPLRLREFKLLTMRPPFFLKQPRNLRPCLKYPVRSPVQGRSRLIVTQPRDVGSGASHQGRGQTGPFNLSGPEDARVWRWGPFRAAAPALGGGLAGGGTSESGRALFGDAGPRPGKGDERRPPGTGPPGTGSRGRGATTPRAGEAGHRSREELTGRGGDRAHFGRDDGAD